MAGSSFSKEVNSHWRVRGVWTSTPNTAGNYSDVTLRVYWESTDSYGTTYSSQSKSGSSTVNGTRDTFSFSAKLSGKDSNLVKTHTERVNHNADGRKSISLSATLDIELDIGGWVGSVTISDSVNLDTIPRKSTLTTNASWTAGGNKTVTVKESYSGFTHKVDIDVQNSAGNWVNVKEISFGGASVNTGFTDAQNKIIFQALGGRASCPARFTLTTLNGGTSIGTDPASGTITAPSSSTARITNPTNVSAGAGQGAYTVWIDQTINLSISRSNGDFTHTVRFMDGNNGGTLKTFTGVETTVSWTPTSAEQNTMYSKTPNGIEFDGNIEVDTFYQGVKVRSTTDNDINYRVRNANPVFTATQVTYKDTNPTTVQLTTNDQIIVQNKSTFKAYVNSGATAQKGATIKSYVLTINGQTVSKTGTGEFAFPKPITAGANQILTIKATDSRGLTVTVTKNVTVLPYVEPTLNATAKRQNSFGENVTLRTNGAISPLNGKNVLSTLQYRYKEKGASSFILDWTDIPKTVTAGTNYAGTNALMVMDVAKVYEIELRVSDSLTTNKLLKATVGAGQPIFFIDADLRSLGFNDFPKNPNEIRVNGRIVFGANMWGNNAGGETDFVGALDMNNSDIVGANAIYFNDASQGRGEGILFLKSTAPDKSRNALDYDNFFIKDGWYHMNGKEFMAVRGTDTNGVSVTIGGDGATIIGAGESQDYVYQNWGLQDGTEQLYLSSDNSIYVYTNVNNGWADRKEFIFQGNGNFLCNGYVVSGGNLRMNGGATFEHTTGTVYLEGKTGATMFMNGGTSRIDVRHDGAGMVQSSTIYSRTTSTGANMHVASNGIIHRVSSSLKYKTGVEAVEGLALSEKVLELQPKTWIDKTQSYHKLLNDMGMGHFEGVPDVLPRHVGLIAEDLVEVGLEGFVIRDENGVLEGIQYDRLWTLLIPIIKDMRREILELKAVKNQGSSTMK